MSFCDVPVRRRPTDSKALASRQHLVLQVESGKMGTDEKKLNGRPKTMDREGARNAIADDQPMKTRDLAHNLAADSQKLWQYFLPKDNLSLWTKK